MAKPASKWNLGGDGFKKFINNNTKSAEDPPGYISGPCERQGSDQAARAKRLEITQNKAMGLATSPAKNVLMTAFMMYMTGNLLFSIDTTAFFSWNFPHQNFRLKKGFQFPNFKFLVALKSQNHFSHFLLFFFNLKKLPKLNEKRHF